MRGNFSIGVRGCSLADRSVIVLIRRWEPIHQFLHYGTVDPVALADVELAQHDTTHHVLRAQAFRTL